MNKKPLVMLMSSCISLCMPLMLRAENDDQRVPGKMRERIDVETSHDAVRTPRSRTNRQKALAADSENLQQPSEYGSARGPGEHPSRLKPVEPGQPPKQRSSRIESFRNKSVAAEPEVLSQVAEQGTEDDPLSQQSIQQEGQKPVAQDEQQKQPLQPSPRPPRFVDDPISSPQKTKKTYPQQPIQPAQQKPIAQDEQQKQPLQPSPRPPRFVDDPIASPQQPQKTHPNQREDQKAVARDEQQKQPLQPSPRPPRFVGDPISSPLRKEDQKAVAQDEPQPQPLQPSPISPPLVDDSHPPSNNEGTKVQPTPKPYGVLITGEFLWWSAHEEGLAFASTGFNNNANRLFVQSSVPRGHVQNFHWKWDPGFRIGLGYQFKTTSWDLYLNWTRFYQHHFRGESSNPSNVLSNGSPLYDEWGQPSILASSAFNSIQAEWRLHYNTLDLELGRKFIPNQYFSVRPFAGLRGVLILQNFDIDEQENNAGFMPSNPIVSIHNQNDYRGIALRAGVNTGFDFCHDWEIFGNLAAALTSGKFEIRNYQQTTQPGIPVPYLNVHDSFWSIKPELEAALGLRWGRNFRNDRCRIELHAAWEELFWPGQNQMRRYLSSSPSSITEKGDLGMHGMTFGARLDF